VREGVWVGEDEDDIFFWFDLVWFGVWWFFGWVAGLVVVWWAWWCTLVVMVM
jgi:hypothetical protein